MSIALVIPDRKLDQLQQKLQQQLPGVAIEIWPDVQEPEAVTMAVLWRQPPGCLSQMSNLKALQSFGAGVDNILIDPTLPDLPLARIVDPMLTQSMLQYLQGVVQHYQLRLDEFSAQQRKQIWKARSPRKLQFICVLGLGELGQAVASHFAGLGFVVSGWSASQKTLAGVQCFAGETAFSDAVGDADLVICLLPLTALTENLLDQQRMALLKPGVILVNVARGAIVDDLALLQNLDSGHIAAACLDVFRTEPLPTEHPFWQHPAILLTPHISAVTNADTAVAQIAENYRRSLAGLPLLNLVCQQRGY
ncbi:glyoxylate/hydroxypyruvate reductase A [Rheinheimera sp. SA_1]|uniref:2-hydroxyacid dehydrogenase n=1 Tax=Rheinheimera sp. SA_1 TaxID=1827365 RepID=UPI000800730F|nr:glyoxylate/hydroxypyruvate reductase A [Rheinheimera sp. SA_1]OBP14019.1 glyoxylate/hydroxypyruvate reductase A [Rheinheimera sp. SA_1]